MRASLYIEGNTGERGVIDTGPEFRFQAIRARISRLDGIFLTHAHADHVHGLDDIRPLCYENPIPVYSNQHTLEELKERFSYIFKDTQRGGGKPRITPFVVSEPVPIGNLTFTPVPVKHGILDILGWKISEAGDRATTVVVYLTDTSRIPDTSLQLIHRPDILIIDGLRLRPHETHFSFLEALETALHIQAQQVYLTHICHDYSHQEIEDFCQRFQRERGGIKVAKPAYDGMELML
jgi:phosphoribosyl 1,2-cyclic phosphate phosphodiesterase